jgi:hypothetical protein
VRVGRLLAEKRRKDPAQAADVDFEPVVRRGPRDATGRESLAAGVADLELDEARLRRSSDVRERFGRRVRRHVLQEREYQAVGEVRRQVQLLELRLLFVVVRVAHRDSASGRLYRHVERPGERRPLLDEMVAHQVKSLPLGEHRRLVVNGAVSKPEAQAGRYPIPACGLHQLSVSERRALQRTKHEEAVNETFGVADRDGLAAEHLSAKHRRDQSDERTALPVAGVRSTHPSLPDRHSPLRSNLRQEQRPDQPPGEPSLLHEAKE